MKKFIKNANIFFKLLGESFAFAYDSVKGDKFRAFLSLLGVTIGIFSIVAVFTAIEGLEKNVKNIFSSLGTDVVYIDKISWDAFTSGEPIKWWGIPAASQQYVRRISVSAETSNTCRPNSPVGHYARSYQVWKKYGKNTTVYGVTYYWNRISFFEVDEGRYFTAAETGENIPLAVVGRNVAEELSGWHFADRK